MRFAQAATNPSSPVAFSKLQASPHSSRLPHKIHVDDSRDHVQFPRLIPRIRGYRHDGPKVPRSHGSRGLVLLPAILPSARDVVSSPSSPRPSCK